jgi:3-oxoacyl-[acyl-carrier protein] reductase
MSENIDNRIEFSIPFEQLQVNDIAELTRTVTKEDVDKFADLSGDYNPLHWDESYAMRTQFGRPVVYGMLTISYVSTIIGMMIPGKGALWTSQTIEFLQPVFINDTIIVKARIKQISKSTRTLVLEISITNQNNQKVVTGESKVKLLELKSGDDTVEDINPRVVLVTGGSRGIGAAVAKKLAHDGYKVLINYNTGEKKANDLLAEIREKGGQAYIFKADISIIEDVINMFDSIKQEVGAVHAVVHCAAPDSALKGFEAIEWSDIQKHLDIQLKGAFNCAKSAIPDMIEGKAGSLVFIGSIVTDGVPPINQMDYVIGKTALTSLAKSLAVEYGPKGIRVNIVSPGMVQTERTERMPEKARMIAKMQTPLRRLGDVEEIADVVAFLISPAARYITGENIKVCGGAVME